MVSLFFMGVIKQHLRSTQTNAVFKMRCMLLDWLRSIFNNFSS